MLSRGGALVDPTAVEIVQLAADLVATMRVSPGCMGLAAPQVGVSAQVFAVDVTGHPKARTVHGKLVLCNAGGRGLAVAGRAREGCMSVPDLTGDVQAGQPDRRSGGHAGHGRAGQGSIPTRSRRGPCGARSTTAEGLLFLDRVAGAHAVYARKVYL